MTALAPAVSGPVLRTFPAARGSLAAARERTMALRGWRRWGLAFLLGALSAAALPPVHLVFLLVPAFIGWLWLIEGSATRRGALSAGWWFGAGHFAAGLYWISNALLVQPELYAWLIPIAIGGFAAGFGVFPGMVAVAVRLVPAGGIGRIAALALAWTAAEWLRSWIFTGFPWNLIGTVWAFSDAMIQPAALFGTFGLGLVTVTLAALPAVLADPGISSRGALTAAGAGAALLAVLWVGGTLRLPAGESPTVENVRLRLVQPNIPQKLKWHPDYRDANLVSQVELSRRPTPDGQAPTHVIWPETAATFFIAHDTQRRDFMAKAAPPGGLLITGAPRRTPPGADAYRVWNSLEAVDGKGGIVGVYDKAHLVPFGEYVPFRGLLDIKKITAGRQDFSAGEGPATLHLPGLPPVGPLICYEIIFPGHVADRNDRPGWLLNLTNDAWYGKSAGPYQHLAATRMRAAEEGLPVVRVAMTGITAVFDGFGRSVGRIGLEKTGVLDTRLPKALDETPYARYGNWTVLAMAALLALALIIPAAEGWRK